MSLHHRIRLIAGTFVLASLALGWWVHPAWLLFTAFVGVNLVQSALTRWCLMETLLVRAGIHRCDDGDPGGPREPAAGAAAAAPLREGPGVQRRRGASRGA